MDAHRYVRGAMTGPRIEQQPDVPGPAASRRCGG